MELLIFCHQHLAYMVPSEVIEIAKRHDRQYEKGEDMDAAMEFFIEIQEKYKPLVIGHLLTGDIG